MDEFVARHASDITGVLHCLDRVIFHGHLPIDYPASMDRFRWTQGIRLEGWARFVQGHSESLRIAAEAVAEAAGRPCVYEKSYVRKEEWAHEVARRDGITAGLVAVLRTTEKCRSFHVRRCPKSGNPRLVAASRRCLHLYFYFIDPQLGWVHVRLQTWFPFLIQIGINGHDILSKLMDRAGQPYQRIENGFVELGNPVAAQRLADQVLDWEWSRHLERIARMVNPLLRTLLRPMKYEWVIDQCEYSTDILFRDARVLQPLFRQLVRHAGDCFAAEDILGFFGRPLHGLYRGEIITEQRPSQWGYRVKHRVGRNWIKSYDKAGSILRVETVINRPQDFRVRRTMCRRDGRKVRGLFPLRKAVVFLRRIVEIQRRANRHYLRALAAVENPATAYGQMKAMGQPVAREGKRQRGINPLRPGDRELMLAVLRCEHHLQGFRNEHIRARLQVIAPEDPSARKRQSARIRRQLLILRAHGYIRRSGGSRRYRVTREGLAVMSASLFYCRQELPTHLMKAA